MLYGSRGGARVGVRAGRSHFFRSKSYVAGSGAECDSRRNGAAVTRTSTDVPHDGRVRASPRGTMDHVPLPQRPPKRRRRREGVAPAAEAHDSAGAAVAAVPNRKGSPEPDWAPETGVPSFAPDVKVVRWVPGRCQYEYKDHTADIQIHSWGDSMEECFAWAALAMFNYMTPLKRLASSALSAKGSAAGTRVPGNANMGAHEDDDEDDANDEDEDAPATEPTVGHSFEVEAHDCLLYTSPSPRDLSTSRMPSSA